MISPGGEKSGPAARGRMIGGPAGGGGCVRRGGAPRDRGLGAGGGAAGVFHNGGLPPPPPAAIADLVHVYAATARDRGMVRREVTPRHAAAEMRAWFAAGEPFGVLIGPERTGLLNDDLALADTVLTVPLNPAFSSLNLAQAVLIVGYEWFTSGVVQPPEILRRGGSRPATKEELLNFFDHLEEELEKNGFLRNGEARPSMVRNLRSLFQRAQCTEQELRTLHGVVTAFAGPRERAKKAVSG